MLQNGMRAVMAIHQPSRRLYKKFDKLMLLSEGHCTYLVPTEHSMNYFHGLRFKPLIEINPPEFFLNLCSGNVSGIEAPEDLKGKQRRIHSDNNNHLNNKGFDDNGRRQVEDPGAFTNNVKVNSPSSNHLNNECLLN